MNRLLCFVLLLVVPTPMMAQTPQIPEPAQKGLEAIADGDYGKALDYWVAHWTAPVDVGKRQQLEAALTQVIGAAGPPSDYEVVKVHDVSARVKWIYVVVAHERMPVYLKLGVYDAPDGWRVATVGFHTNIEQVFPASLREPQ